MSWSLLAVHFFLLYFIVLHWWRRFRHHRANLRFTFRITDIWASMLGLFPTMYAARFFLDEHAEIKDLIIMQVLMASSQIVGLLIGRIHIELPPHTGAQSALQSAISIVTGALIGLFIAAFTLIVSAIISFNSFFMIVFGVLAIIVGGNRFFFPNPKS